MSSAVLSALEKKFGDAIHETSSPLGEDVAVVDGAKLAEIAGWLKTDPAMAFDAPVFVTCIDRLGFPLPPEQVSKFKFSASDADDVEPEDLEEDEGPRFEVVVALRSHRHRHRVRLKVRCAENALEVPSLAHLWPAFNWLERECWDMYGVRFTGHGDLRRIYMYEEFVGHPLRKDYPKDRRQPLVRREWSDEVTEFSGTESRPSEEVNDG